MIHASPLARPFPNLPAIQGVELRTACAGYKAWERSDLTYITFAQGTTIAGLTTRNVCTSPEVELCRAHLPHAHARALIVNAGNSNAFTGHRGRAAVDAMVQKVATHLDCPQEHIYISSTGVIGVPLPQEKAQAGLDAAFAAPHCSWEAVARTISTTDTFPKGACVQAMLGGVRVSLVGVIKGSGMIMPDMATMLGYIFTDAAVSADYLQACLNAANGASFGSITVDSDTSTSDTVLAFATGAAGNALLTSADSVGADAFLSAMKDLCQQLALLVVRDGEGATKLISVQVSGAVSDLSAHIIAKAIANSPLVKTAMAGEDANWGRVVMAVGKAGQPADRDRLTISFGTTKVAEHGMVVEGYDEAPVSAHLKGQEIDINVDIGLGTGRAQVWTCDLTHGYISINADYRS